MHIKTLTWLTATGFVLMLIALGGLTARPRSAVRFIPQPEHWVAFSADIVINAADGRTAHGRFYRRGDGSRRTEIQSPINAAELSINIRNESDRVMYYHEPLTGEWRLMALQGEQATPRQFPVDLAGLSSTPEKATHEGLTVYSLADKSAYGLFAPDLNFLKVYERDKSGETTEYINIQREAPRDELFRPPHGAILDRVTSFKELTQHSSRRPLQK